jgi:hypothetical protein
MITAYITSSTSNQYVSVQAKVLPTVQAGLHSFPVYLMYSGIAQLMCKSTEAMRTEQKVVLLNAFMPQLEMIKCYLAVIKEAHGIKRCRPYNLPRIYHFIC